MTKENSYNMPPKGLFGKRCRIKHCSNLERGFVYRIVNDGVRSNTWRELPLGRFGKEPVLHDTFEEVVFVVCDTLIDESSKIEKVALKDIEIIEQEPCDKCVYSTSEGCQYDDITETIPPFEDCISRQAVLDKLNRLIEVEHLQGTDEMGYGRERVSAYESMKFEIESEYLYPSASSSEKPNKCEDAISRQAAIDAIYARYIGGKEAVDKAPANDQYAEGIDEAVCAVEDLPPVTPQPKSECEHDHEILKAYSDGASAVLDNVRAEISERSRMHMDGDLYIKTSDCMQIIDEFTAEEDKA